MIRQMPSLVSEFKSRSGWSSWFLPVFISSDDFSAHNTIRTSYVMQALVMANVVRT